MKRLVICLPICLLFAPRIPDLDQYPEEGPPGLRDHPIAADMLVVYAAQPQTAFPGAVPWASLAYAVQFRKPPYTDPVKFLAKCLERYDREVRGYTLTMRKTERVGGELRRTEIILVHFREKPYSVYFDWKHGIGLARRALYVEGENDNQMVVKTFLGNLKEFDPNGSTAMSSSRYPITEFGFKIATERVYRTWKEAQAEGTLFVEYLGLQQVPETGDRWCHVLHRTRYARVPEDGVTDLTLYIDRDTLLQLGSVLRDSKGHLMGEYYFRDVRLNPDFPDWQFTREALKK